MDIKNLKDYLAVKFDSDPFSTSNDNKASLDQLNIIKPLQAAIKKHNFSKNQNEESYENHLNSYKKNFNESEENIMSIENMLIKYHDFIDDNILTHIKLEFKSKMTDGNIRKDEMNPKGLWRIESNDIFQGDSLKWDEPYRLRNLLMGRYLKVKRTIHENVLDFSGEINSDGMFCFQPITNHLRDKDSKKYITSENYFRIQSNTKEWISIKKRNLNRNKSITIKLKNMPKNNVKFLESNEPFLNSECLFHKFKCVKSN